ncbi:hypothetical protein NQZ68_036710 [Dissostichus eleginoides]|nr:hypothetical protein NQZ68_036710 [Dissostichus eleginoides]
MKLSNVCFSSSGSLLKHSPINASLQRHVGRKEEELKIPAEHLNPELLTVLSADNPDVKKPGKRRRSLTLPGVQRGESGPLGERERARRGVPAAPGEREPRPGWTPGGTPTENRVSRGEASHQSTQSVSSSLGGWPKKKRSESEWRRYCREEITMLEEGRPGHPSSSLMKEGGMVGCTPFLPSSHPPHCPPFLPSSHPPHLPPFLPTGALLLPL